MTRSTFTFVESLAALIIVAIVLPVVVHGVLVAARVAEVGQRSEIAARLAERQLNEWILTGEWETAETEGTFDEWPGYRWELETKDWTEDDDLDTAMTQLTIRVHFGLQQGEQTIALHTLVAPEETE